MSGEWGATQGKGCVQGGDRRSSHGRIGTLMHPLSFVAFYSARTNTYIGSPSQTKKCRAGRRTTVDGRGLAQDGNGGRRDGRRNRRSGRTRTFVQQQWERHRPLRCDHFSWFDLNLIPNCYLTCLLFRSRPPTQESDNTRVRQKRLSRQTYRPRRLQLQYRLVSIRTLRYIDHCLFYFLQPNFKPISTATQM